MAFESLIIYHNPKCSKSRQTLEILKKNGEEPQIIEYLKTPFNLETLNRILLKLNKKPIDIIRVKDPAFKELDADTSDESGLLDLMVANPKIVERPIVESKNSAVVGRPPENVLSLLK